MASTSSASSSGETSDPTVGLNSDFERVSEPGASESGSPELFTSLARTGLFLQALQRECLANHGLAFTEFSVLRMLQTAPDKRLPPSVLAEKIVCTTGAMTKIVDRLQRSALVERGPDPADRRGVLVQITAKGQRNANDAAATYRAGRERVLARLDKREAEQIHNGLQRLLEALESDRSES
jgi:DNA-binding MarR family transcriptional regulator